MPRKKKKKNTLVVVFEALVAAKEILIVQLRNDTRIKGICHFVDRELNMMMESAELWLPPPSGTKEVVQNIYISGRNIRYIELPATIDIEQTLELHRELMRKAQKKYSRGGGPTPQQKES